MSPQNLHSLEPLLICDLRPEWNKNPFVTFWRAGNGGYAYPLSWAGNYSVEKVLEGYDYYCAANHRAKIRFAIPRRVVEKLAIAPPTGRIDGNAGPVVLNNPTNRSRLRRRAFWVDKPAEFNPKVYRRIDEPMMHCINHALGSPTFPMRATYRNFFAAASPQLIDEMEASPFWERTCSDGVCVIFSVTNEGRWALADYLREHAVAA